MCVCVCICVPVHMCVPTHITVTDKMGLSLYIAECVLAHSGPVLWGPEIPGKWPTGKSCQIPLSTKEFSKCKKQPAVFRKADPGFAVGSALFTQLSWVLRGQIQQDVGQAPTMSLSLCT